MLNKLTNPVLKFCIRIFWKVAKHKTCEISDSLIIILIIIFRVSQPFTGRGPLFKFHCVHEIT